MEYSAKSDIGNHREQNEDYYYAADNLFIVADGMGGQNAGEVASKTAVDRFVEFFNKQVNTTGKLKNRPGFNEVEKLLTGSMRYANDEILKLANSNPGYTGMGTTFTGCYVGFDNKNPVAHIIHAGDSRAYLKDKNNFKLLTSDHSLVGKMFRNGLITYDETFSHPLRNYLENVLGLESEFKSDYLQINLVPGNIMVLCTDGLNSMLRDAVIDNIITESGKPQKITENLILSAKASGGLDNITVITIKI